MERSSRCWGGEQSVSGRFLQAWVGSLMNERAGVSWLLPFSLSFPGAQIPDSASPEKPSVPHCSHLARMHLPHPPLPPSGLGGDGWGAMRLLSCHGIFWEAVQKWQAFPRHPAPAQPLPNKDNPQGLAALSALGEAAGEESWECPRESRRVRPCRGRMLRRRLPEVLMPCTILHRHV